MLKTILASCALFFGAMTAGCFGDSVEEHERDAQRHQIRADRAAARRDYDRAAIEQHKAERDRREAWHAHQSYLEDRDDYVPTPAPPPPVIPY